MSSYTNGVVLRNLNSMSSWPFKATKFIKFPQHQNTKRTHITYMISTYNEEKESKKRYIKLTCWTSFGEFRVDIKRPPRTGLRLKLRNQAIKVTLLVKLVLLNSNNIVKGLNSGVISKYWDKKKANPSFYQKVHDLSF